MNDQRAALPLDELIPRLRARAADPDRRTTTRPSTMFATVRSMGPGGLLAMASSVAADLDRVVRAIHDGRIDPDGVARAEALEESMLTPAPSVLPGPADPGRIADFERDVGLRLPTAMRRVFAEVADGGFGPGEGILPLSSVMAVYRELRSPGAMPRGRSWPGGLLPLVAMEPGWDCVEAASGRVIAWDPEDLTERVSEAAFASSFRAIFPSVEAWLTGWVGSRTQAEAQADMLARFMSPEHQVQQAREARDAIGRMRPAERSAIGLPEEGWERVVWGGLGWEDGPVEAPEDSQRR